MLLFFIIIIYLNKSVQGVFTHLACENIVVKSVVEFFDLHFPHHGPCIVFLDI